MHTSNDRGHVNMCGSKLTTCAVSRMNQEACCGCVNQGPRGCRMAAQGSSSLGSTLQMGPPASLCCPGCVQPLPLPMWPRASCRYLKVKPLVVDNDMCASRGME